MYVYAQTTDIGIKRKINQDSIITQVAEVTGYGPVLMSAVCDGMGGLEDGEVASSIMVEHLREWFSGTLYHIIVEDTEIPFETRLFTSLRKVCREANLEIRKWSREKMERPTSDGKTYCGTTLALLILFRQRAYILNVGDSRVYLIRNSIHQLTRDQTVTQQKLDRKEITEAEALNDPGRSTLWQCIGVGSNIVPECQTTMCLPNDIYLLCSDGFRHKVSHEEIQNVILKDGSDTAEALSDKVGFLIEENKRRRESDNISAILIKNVVEK